MAHSSYIYVIGIRLPSGGPSLPVATFTVKHEAVAWVRGTLSKFLADKPALAWEAARFRDGVSSLDPDDPPMISVSEEFAQLIKDSAE